MRGEKPLKVKQLLKTTQQTYKKKKKKKKNKNLKIFLETTPLTKLASFITYVILKTFLDRGWSVFVFFNKTIVSIGERDLNINSPCKGD